MTDPADRMLMTPGPTEVPADVREAMARPAHNPDVEPEFEEFYQSLLAKLGEVYGTDDELVILGGEGILGLEAAAESLVESGDEVLCLANGIYGAGFADFVDAAEGDPVLHEVGHDEAFDPEAVKEVVEDHEFEVATMVHCETPTGLLNDLEAVLEVLQDAGVITVVDAVSSLGGTAVPIESIDVCLGATQKCFSAPPGLSTISVSDQAWAKVEDTEQGGFYTSLAPFHDPDFGGEGPALPYTQLVSNCYSLDAALDRLQEEGLERVFERHERTAERCRELGAAIGLEPYPGSDLSSPTVTAFAVEERATDLQGRIAAEHDVVLATGLGETADDILRVGHMGYNADVDRVERAMDAVAAALE